MVDKRVRDLAASSPLVGTEKFYADNGASDVYVTGTQISTFVGGPDWVNVKSYGAVGDNVTDDTAAIQSAIDAAFGTYASPHGTDYHLNRPLYFPRGIYVISSPLQLSRRLQGAKIFGDGRFSTTIRQTVNSSDAFKTDGLSYSSISDMAIQVGNAAGGTGTCFNYDWLGPGTTGGAGHQSVTFQNMQFTYGGIGVLIADQTFQGSENLFLECFFGGQSIAGIKSDAFNALQNTVIACNFSGIDFSDTGTGMGAIWCGNGSFPLIASCGFQVNGCPDIRIDSSANDCMVITGCRSEIPTDVDAPFIALGGFVSCLIQNCLQANGDPSAVFCATEASLVTIEGCQSIAGSITEAGQSPLTIRQSAFGRRPLWDPVAPNVDSGQVLVLGVGAFTSLDDSIEIENVQTGSTYNGSVPTGEVIDVVRYRRTRIDANGENDYVLRQAPTNASIFGPFGGVVAVSGDYNYLDTEGLAAADDIDTINTFQTPFNGQRLTLRSTNNARVVTLKDGTGNLSLNGDFVMDNTSDTITLIYDTALAAWLEQSRSSNG